MADDFFAEQEDQSAVKSAIVVDYFGAWSKIMAPRSPKIAYVDLFAGPGGYDKGELSTPLLILQRAIASDPVRTRLVTIFNDKNRDHVKALQKAIDALPGIERLTFKPDVQHGVVNEELAERFQSIRTVPMLAFIDPYGYKGLSLDLIRGLIKDFGSEVIFFFNHNRVNPAITNEAVERHMVALFGEARLRALRFSLPTIPPRERSILITRTPGEALLEIGASYFIPFGFRKNRGRLSHYVCFASKNELGYRIMKDVMAKHSVADDDGVPRFEYVPPTSGRQLRLDEERPLLGLPVDLRRAFGGRTVSVKEIIQSHTVGTYFIPKNYRKVLLDMEAGGQVSCKPNVASRPKNTIADHVMVTFPRST